MSVIFKKYICDAHYLVIETFFLMQKNSFKSNFIKKYFIKESECNCSHVHSLILGEAENEL